MSVYKGAPTYELLCDEDGCVASGPVKYSEDAAIEAALDAGWATEAGPNHDKDLCPRHNGA